MMALLLPISCFEYPTDSMIAFKAPTRGSETCCNTGKLFFIANFCDVSLRFHKNPPSGNRTIHSLFLGTYELNICVTRACIELSLLPLP